MSINNRYSREGTPMANAESSEGEPPLTERGVLSESTSLDTLLGAILGRDVDRAVWVPRSAPTSPQVSAVLAEPDNAYDAELVRFLERQPATTSREEAPAPPAPPDPSTRRWPFRLPRWPWRRVSAVISLATVGYATCVGANAAVSSLMSDATLPSAAPPRLWQFITAPPGAVAAEPALTALTLTHTGEGLAPSSVAPADVTVRKTPPRRQRSPVRRSRPVNSAPPLLPSRTPAARAALAFTHARVSTVSALKEVERMAPAIPVRTSAVLLQGDTPDYPAALRMARISGTVDVRFTIGRDGRVTKAEAINGLVPFRVAAEAAVMRRRYTPATLDGKPVESESTIRFTFESIRRQR
jgi:TonB family protein